jgi:PiT family inorganic phosphate transporter
MSAGLFAVVAAAVALAFANGANDNAKGVATLIGAGRLALRPAVAYATAATLLGSAAALLLARGLLARFGGKGILGAELLENPAFPLAVATAAGATVWLSTRLGLPVSTTHALVGGLAGVGLAAGSLDGVALASAVFGPLLLSPLVALGVTAAGYPLLRRLRLALGVTHESCVCVAATPQAALTAAGAAAAARRVGLSVVHDETARCAGYAGTVAGIGAQRALDACHLLTAGAVSFARGVNDTPKIAALLLLAAPFGGAAGPSLVAVGLAMAAGGLLAARRVATTMSHRITAMNDGQAFAANLTTALLVLVASRFGLPVSTTHVSVGALFGIGAATGTARWRTIAAIVLSWLVVLPLSAALAAGLWLALER